MSLTEEELGMLFGAAPQENDCHNTVCQPIAATYTRTCISTTLSNRSKVKTSSAVQHPSLLSFDGSFVPARCGYRTGKCLNLQAFKRDGKAHKLCEFHRERANINQKKLDRKKRMQRTKLPSEAHTPPCKSVSSALSIKNKEENCSFTAENHSPRTVESAVNNGVLMLSESKMEHDDVNTELFLPTNLHEAPLVLSCEELDIFRSIMTIDVSCRLPLRRNAPSLRTPTCYCLV
ncbi:uncharacterized protein PHALS_04353 [Plasmopara halstedii]|uniref:Uncharacterized protein n=1 Tax=Plasmopara halstedii TaxID=4781 RepID=A0A0P1B185_PLAHL|nr:uncharacterized protein PHALS_04353 [Plasmopara halstedii]CEG47482.1 hypothetical protein PHALS_04353 [Plasmopara halstedii]|eukprot:XP_024583851.1 hypothetical protein PHALS_04353 [Plasmopara halstedii]